MDLSKYSKPDRKDKDNSSNDNSNNNKGGGNSKLEKELAKQNAALKKSLELLQETLEAKGIEAPPQPDQGKGDAEARLEALKRAKSSMLEAGLDTADLDEKIMAAEAAVEQLKARPDLRAVMGKLKAADAHKNQCAEQFVKAQEALANARERLVKSEAAKIQLEKEKKILLENEMQKSGMEGQLATATPQLPQAPGNLTAEEQATWEASIQQIQQQQQQAMQQQQQNFQNQVATLLQAFRKDGPEPINGEPAAPKGAAEAPAEGGGSSIHEEQPAAKLARIDEGNGLEEMATEEGGEEAKAEVPVLDAGIKAEAEAAAEKSAEAVRNASAAKKEGNGKSRAKPY